MRSTWRSQIHATLVVATILVAPRAAEAVEVSGGVGVGGIAAGTTPHFAVSPHVALSWTLSNGFMFGVREIVHILPSIRGSRPGFHEQTAGVIGYASETWNGTVGPSLSVYDMWTCGRSYCGRVLGLAPGGHIHVNRYFYGRWGLAVSGSVDWIGGASHVLPGGAVGMIVAGPVLRWIEE